MIESPEDGSSRRRFSRPLMVGGLGLWGVGVSSALAPPVMRTILYPNHTEVLQFERVAADPFGTPILWTALVVLVPLVDFRRWDTSRQPGRRIRGTFRGRRRLSLS